MGTNGIQERKGNFKRSLPYFAVAGGLLALAGLLMALFAQFGHAFFPAYRNFSKAVMAALSTVAGLVPFALWDMLAVLLGIALVATSVHALVRSRSLWRWLATICVVLAAFALFLVGGWALNYYAPPLAQELSLDVHEYSADDLAETTGYYLGQAAALAPTVAREEDARLADQDFTELAVLCGAGYGPLAQRYPVFEGSTARVKALLVAGEPLLYWGYVGIFWPLTAESSVPLNCAAEDLPFTMCHEAAHRLGIASEQEANFAAFLACTENDDARLRYAGYYAAFNYCFDALASSNPARAQQLIEEMLGEDPDPADERIRGIVLVFADRQNAAAHYQPYKGPVAEVGTAANDTYLKAFNQEEGVRSYGLVADYLIAWHQQG